MRRFIINALWVVFAIPFYMLVLCSCLYSCILALFFKRLESVIPYKWIDSLDSWVFNKKNKYL